MIKELLLISTLLFPTLQKEDAPHQPLILFEFNYTNHSLGFNNQGFIIDNQGQVHSYYSRDKKDEIKFRDWAFGKWDSPSLCWEMTPAEIEKNLSLCDSIAYTINKDTL